jgi:hypothetical protein
VGQVHPDAGSEDWVKTLGGAVDDLHVGSGDD